MHVRTYADGSGAWHAVVPDVGSVQSQRQRARRAIAAAVRIRQGDDDPIIRLGPTPPLMAPGRNPVRDWAEY